MASCTNGGSKLLHLCRVMSQTLCLGCFLQCCVLNLTCLMFGVSVSIQHSFAPKMDSTLEFAPEGGLKNTWNQPLSLNCVMLTCSLFPRKRSVEKGLCYLLSCPGRCVGQVLICYRVNATCWCRLMTD